VNPHQEGDEVNFHLPPKFNGFEDESEEIKEEEKKEVREENGADELK